MNQTPSGDSTRQPALIAALNAVSTCRLKVTARAVSKPRSRREPPPAPGTDPLPSLPPQTGAARHRLLRPVCRGNPRALPLPRLRFDRHRRRRRRRAGHVARPAPRLELSDLAGEETGRPMTRGRTPRRRRYLMRRRQLTTAQRGYDARHQALRRQVAKVVAAGRASCWRCVDGSTRPNLGILATTTIALPSTFACIAALSIVPAHAARAGGNDGATPYPRRHRRVAPGRGHERWTSSIRNPLIHSRLQMAKMSEIRCGAGDYGDRDNRAFLGRNSLAAALTALSIHCRYHGGVYVSPKVAAQQWFSCFVGNRKCFNCKRIGTNARNKNGRYKT